MAFKMNGWNAGQGTGSQSALKKTNSGSVYKTGPFRKNGTDDKKYEPYAIMEEKPMTEYEKKLYDLTGQLPSGWRSRREGDDLSQLESVQDINTDDVNQRWYEKHGLDKEKIENADPNAITWEEQPSEAFKK